MTHISNSLAYLASAYNTGFYGTSTYNGSSTTSNNVISGNTGSGILTNTGFDVTAIVTIAALILLTAVLVRIWIRQGTKKLEHSDISIH